MDTVLRLEDENLQLKEAVRSHAVVDQAIGVILAVGQLTPDQGWDVLRSTSQNTNIKLRHVAELIVDRAAVPLDSRGQERRQAVIVTPGASDHGPHKDEESRIHPRSRRRNHRAQGQQPRRSRRPRGSRERRCAGRWPARPRAGAAGQTAGEATAGQPWP